MTQRTDIHRPSAIDPTNYSAFSWTYLGIPSGEEDIWPEEIAIENAHRQQVMQENGWHYATHEHGGTCHVCGAHALYLVFFVHDPTGEVIATGEDCAAKIELPTSGLFTRARKAVEAGRKYAAGIRNAEQQMGEHGLIGMWAWYRSTGGRILEGPKYSTDAAGAFNRYSQRCWNPNLGQYEWTEEHDALEAAVEAEKKENDRIHLEWVQRMDQQFGRAWRIAQGKEQTASDIIGRLVRYGDLSKKQWTYLASLWSFLLDWEAAAMQQQLKRQSERDAAADCPEGRVQIKGVILKAESRDDGFSTRNVMTVKTDAGWLCWGTIPMSILDEIDGPIQGFKGAQVRFTASLTPSDKDKKFGFYKRPSKAEVIDQPDAVSN
jgi:hypothetical protein